MLMNAQSVDARLCDLAEQIRAGSSEQIKAHFDELLEDLEYACRPVYSLDREDRRKPAHCLGDVSRWQAARDELRRVGVMLRRNDRERAIEHIEAAKRDLLSTVMLVDPLAPKSDG